MTNFILVCNDNELDFTYDVIIFIHIFKMTKCPSDHGGFFQMHSLAYFQGPKSHQIKSWTNLHIDWKIFCSHFRIVKKEYKIPFNHRNTSNIY